MRFVWDENKNIINIKKHKVSFREASEIFTRRDTIVTDDVLHSTDIEERFYAIGRSFRKNILYVVFCVRFGDVIRIISARLANKNEKERYYAGC